MAVAQHVEHEVHRDHGDVAVVVRPCGRRHEERVQERHPGQVVGQGHPGGVGDLQQLVHVTVDLVTRSPEHESTGGPGDEAVVPEGTHGELPRQRRQ